MKRERAWVAAWFSLFISRPAKRGQNICSPLKERTDIRSTIRRLIVTHKSQPIRPARPILHYHGSKWKLADWLISFFPPHRRYVEPFGGSGSVLLRKPRSQTEIYNDLHGDLVNLFRVLRDPDKAAQLKTQIEATPYARSELEASAEQTVEDDLEKARRTLIRAMMGFHTGASNPARPTGFGGLTNAGTHPARSWRQWPHEISVFTARLQGVVIENLSAETIIARYDTEDTLFYVDPPYPWETRTTPHAYAHDMREEDHRKLAECLHAVTGMVILQMTLW